MYNNFSSKKTKKVISALLASALVVTSAPISADAATSKVVGVGKTFKVTKTTKVSGLSAAEKKIVKATVNKSKKTVTVKGLKAGKATFKIGSKTYNVKVGATAIKAKSFATTLTVGTNKSVSVTATNGKKDTLTWKSSQTGVVKVSNATTKASSSKVAKNTLKAVKAGKSTITVKSKYTGKYLKVKVTVKAADATVTAAPTATGGAVATQTPTQTPAQTPAQTPSAQETQNPVQTPSAQETQNPATATAGAVTVTANVPGASIKITSGSAVLSAISMDADKTSATTAVLAPGTYAIEVSKDGYDPYKGTVTVNGATAVNVTLKESIQTGATAVVANALADYKNTVLVNDNAEVTVTVKDANGAPVANKSVVFSLSNEKTYNSDPKKKNIGFEIKGNTVVTTDASGKATFVVGTKEQGLKVDATDYVGSVQFRASVVGSTDKADVATGTIGFAAIQLGTVDLYQDVDKKETHLVKGENAVGVTDATIETKALSGFDSEYIATQQVSKAGTKENQVTFSVAPKIVLPGYDEATDEVKEFIQTIDKQSGEYGTYTDKSEIVVLDVDTSTLQYATLNIKNIQLSKYTKMEIMCYADAECKVPILDSKQTVEGEKEQSSFAYQIPLTKAKVKAVKVSLESAGQVQTDKNDGFNLASITGVYNGVGTSKTAGAQLLSSAKINWEVATPTLSNEMVLKAEDAMNVLGIMPADIVSGAGARSTATTSSTFTYQVPVFPYTGNAVIKEYDKNNNVITYYLAPTKNDVDETTGAYKNANEIAAFVNKKLNTSYAGLKAYKATEEEASKLLSGNIEVDGNKVRINSEKVGSTTVKGTISIDGIGSEQLNAANSTVYTSVHWNPIPVVETKVDKSNAFLALAGQKITVYAQLTDANNNPVSLANEKVTFNWGTDKIEGSATAVDGVTIVSNNGTTDVNGRTKLVLSAAQADELIKLNAEAANDKYNVVLLVGGVNATPVEKADLYWVDANLSFKNSALDKDVVEVTTENNSKVANVSDPLVGTPWEFAVKTVGNTIGKDKGELSEYKIDVNGLKIAMSGDADNKGTYDFTTGNGVALATSKVADEDKIIAKIDDSSVTSDVTFKASKTLSDGTVDVKEFVCVGEGSPNLNAKLTLNVDWQKVGTKLALITPMGTNIGAESTSIYVKVTDGTGENVAAGETVTFKSGNEKDVFVVDGEVSIGKATVTTNSDGIAKVEIKKSAAASSIVSATVDNVDQIVSTTINWINDASSDFYAVNAAMKENSATEVELTFNNAVLAESVQAGEFNLYSYSDDAKTKKVYYDVTSAKASGKKVILTVSQALGAGQYTIDFGTKKVDGVTYQLVDEAGKAIAAESKINFYSTKNASYDLSQTTVGDETTITISNVKSPVDVKVEDFIVTVNGVVSAGAVTANTDGTYEVKIAQTTESQNVVIYYFGNAESTKVAAK